MSQRIEIPGQGIVEFPDGMTDAQIEAAIKRNSQPIDKTTGVIRNVGEGATLGFLDEAMLGLGSVIASMTNKDKSNRNMFDYYKEARQAYNKEQEQFAKENPALAIGSTIAGGLLTAPLTAGGAAAQAIKAKSLLPLAKQSALLGGVSGVGFAPTAGDIPTSAALGAAMGWATPYAMQGVMNTVKGTVGAAKGLLGLPGKLVQNVDEAAQQSAAKQIGQAFQRDQIPIPQALSQAQSLGPEGVMADVGGENVKRLLQTVASQPGQTAQLAEKTLQSRMNTSVPRILDALKRTVGKDQSVFRTTKDLLERRGAEASPLYNEAMKESVDQTAMSNLISGIDDIVTSAKGTKLGAQLKSVQNSLVQKSGLPKTSVKDLHWAKMDIDDKISSAKRAGNNALVAELMKVKTGLLSVMDGDPANPSLYGQARKIFSDHSSVLNSIETGRKILSTNPEEMAATIQNMSKADMDGYLVGAREAIADTIKRTPEGGNAARRVATYAVREKLAQAFPSEEALNKFMKALDVEDTFAQLRNVTTRGSQTQQRISNEALVGLSAASDAAQGRFLSVVMGKIAQFVNNYKHIPEPVRDEIGKMLLSDFSKTGQISTKLLQKMAKHQIRQDQIKQLITTVNASTSPAMIMGEQKAMQ